MCHYSKTSAPLLSETLHHSTKICTVSLPLGEEYTYIGEKNLDETIQALFSKPFGGGYPESEAKRKIADAKKLKEMKLKSQINFEMFLNKLEPDMVKKVKHRYLHNRFVLTDNE